MAAIDNDWLPAVNAEFKKPYYAELYKFVKAEYSRVAVFPPSDEIFSALHLTPLSKVKVVIIGQDPYHNVGQAHGLCFSVRPEVEIPPSLVNIYKELAPCQESHSFFCARETEKAWGAARAIKKAEERERNVKKFSYPLAIPRKLCYDKRG